MLSFGRIITSPADPLQKVTVKQVFNGIKHAKPAFQDRINQLRTLQGVDPTRYRNQKRSLPYFVCGTFHPSVRRKENFASIRYLVLDLDHLADAGFNHELLLNKLKKVPEIHLCFTSPGGDGLKVLFKLQEDCRDSALFSTFYKLFALRFAQKWELEPVIDLRTHDVTRACFVSYDPAAWWNPDAQPLNLREFISDFDFDKAEKDLRKAEAELEVPSRRASDPTSGPDSEILNRIKAKLNPNYRIKEKQHHVPQEVNAALGQIHEHLTAVGMDLVDTQPISYGRKLHIKSSHLFAEINIFYGKRGFTVVKTTKTGSNPELASLAQQAIEEVLFMPLQTEADGPTP